MTEEIIINCVDVSECCFYNNGKCDNPNGMACNCINNAVCYFKELKRLEQERDELKKTVENQKLEYEELQCDLSEVENTCGCYQSENAELKQENKELKEVKEQLKKWNDENLKRQDDMQLWIDLAEEQRKKYRSVLEEIKEIVNEPCIEDEDCETCDSNCMCKEILTKINECLGE